MKNFIKILSILAIIGIVIVGCLLVLDVVTSAESKDILQKTLLVLGIVALGGVAVSFFSRTDKNPSQS